MLTQTVKNTKEYIEEFVSKDTNNFLVLCMNSNTKEQLQKELNTPKASIRTFNNFITSIFKTCFCEEEFKKISDFYAIEIIYSICEKRLLKNKALKNLCRSKQFARELYNLFGLFKVNELSCEVLSDTNKNAEISQEDKDRFEIVLDIYREYSNLLEENNMLDYRDVVIKCIKFLQGNETIRKNISERYDYIFVDDAQNFSQIQYNLLSLLKEEKNIFLLADFNAKTRTFLGANIIQNANIKEVSKCQNEDILKRALFITKGFLDSDQTDAVDYCIFSDFQSEMEFISKDILSDIKNGAKYSDFAILIRDNSVKQSIINLLKENQIPANSDLYNENYQSFKQTFIRITEFCDTLKKLGIKEFTKNLADEITIKSKVDTQTFSQQINLLAENILSNLIQNKYSLEKCLILQERNKDIFLTDTVFKNYELFSEDEKNKISEFFENIKNIYKYYIENNYAEIIKIIAESDKKEDTEYSELIANLTEKTNDITALKKGILKEKVEIGTIFDLLEMQSEDSFEDKDCVKVLTFFKAAGSKFKKVYIPYLTENYFPKKTKTTLFISIHANDVLSQNIQKINNNFEKIILSNKEEFKDEECLIYVAMTCASEKVILSTHEYEDKKKVVPSSFLEQLIFADNINFIEQKDKLNITTQEKDLNGEQILSSQIMPVLDKNEKFQLSATTINQFLQCPKQFYFRRLLNLKEEKTDKKSYGILVHAIFELLFSAKYLPFFGKEKALELSELIFNSPNDTQKAINAGFSQELAQDICNMSDLEREEMKEILKDAFDSLESKGFFAQKPTDAKQEKRFSFSIPEIPNITFSGSIDAIIKNENGWTLLDYKTGGNKKKVKNLFTEKELDFIGRDGFSETKVRDYEYQIPLYYLAYLFSENIKRENISLSKIGYQYVRPSYIHDGSTSDITEVEGFEQFKDKLIENIKKYVVDELYSKSDFEARKTNLCNSCSYKSICDIEDGEGEEDND